MARSIVVGVDFSEPSRQAFDAAIGFAEGLGATLDIVHAFAHVPNPLITPEIHGDLLSELQQQTDMEEAILLSKDWAAKARAAGIEATVHTFDRHAAKRILQVAEETKATAIVVGTHGRSGWRRALLGSVAAGVIRKSTRPVLVIPVRPA